MTLSECIEILENHNKWRRGDDDLPPTNPKKLGNALDYAIEELRKLR